MTAREENQAERVIASKERSGGQTTLIVLEHIAQDLPILGVHPGASPY